MHHGITELVRKCSCELFKVPWRKIILKRSTKYGPGRKLSVCCTDLIVLSKKKVPLLWV